MSDNPHNMTMEKTSEFTGKDSWSHYWETADSDGGGAVRSEKQAQLLAAWWHEALAEASKAVPPKRVLDAACGAGVVTAIARSLESLRDVEFVCSDYSPDALASARESLGEQGVEYKVADATKMPFDTDSFDWVVSQFGLEYGGMDAFVEAARLVGPAGRFMALVHSSDGAIAEECAGNLSVLRAAQKADLIGHAERLLESARFDDAEKSRAMEAAFGASFQALEAQLAGSKSGPAYTFVARLANDLVQIYNRRSAHQPDELVKWMAEKRRELDGFAVRMQTMVDSAMSEDQMSKIGACFQKAGLSECEVAPVSFEQDKPASAWSIIATVGA